MIVTALYLGLAAWRISYMFTQESGPFDVFVHIRELFGIEHDEDGPNLWPNGYVPQMFSCIYCFSFNVALVLALGSYFFPTFTNYIALPFAIGAVAIGISHVTVD